MTTSSVRLKIILRGGEVDTLQHPEGDLPLTLLLQHARSSMGAGTSVGDAGPSTSSTMPSTSGLCYACEDWMSRLSIGKLKSIAHEYRMGDISRWPRLNKKLHLPFVNYMVFSKVILKAGVSLPLHPFIDDILQFFTVVPFHLTLNTYCIIVTFYVAFTETRGFEPSVGHFAYMIKIKAFMSDLGIWDMTGRDDITGIGGIPSDIGQWKNDFFFYPYAWSGEFRMVRKWQLAHCPSLI